MLNRAQRRQVKRVITKCEGFTPGSVAIRYITLTGRICHEEVELKVEWEHINTGYTGNITVWKGDGVYRDSIHAFPKTHICREGEDW